MLMRELGVRGVRDGDAGGIIISHCKNVAESSHYEVSRGSSFTKYPEDPTPYRHSPSNHQRQHGIKTRVPVIFVEAVIANSQNLLGAQQQTTDKQNVVYIHSGVSFIQAEQILSPVRKKTHRTWDDYVRGKRLDSKTMVMCFLSYMEDREGREELTLE